MHSPRHDRVARATRSRGGLNWSSQHFMIFVFGRRDGVVVAGISGQAGLCRLQLDGRCDGESAGEAVTFFVVSGRGHLS
jgi:hypothetical protein